MPIPSTITRLANRTSEQARVPIRQLRLPSYPDDVLKRFPSMVEFRRREIREITEWIASLNTGRETQP